MLDYSGNLDFDFRNLLQREKLNCAQLTLQISFIAAGSPSLNKNNRGSLLNSCFKNR